VRTIHAINLNRYHSVFDKPQWKHCGLSLILRSFAHSLLPGTIKNGAKPTILLGTAVAPGLISNIPDNRRSAHYEGSNRL
jgi:hypothetical protein